MTDTTETTVEEQTPAPEGSGPKELREALKRANEERDKYKAQAMTTAFKQVGLDPDKGMGKLIAEHYDGEPDAEALAAYASQYGHEVPNVENENQPAIDAGNARLDQVNQSADPSEPMTPAEIARRAQAEGNMVLAQNAKVAQIRQKMK